MRRCVGVAILVLAAGCARDLGLDENVFQCRSNADCVRDTRCLETLGICVPTDTGDGCGNGYVEPNEGCDASDEPFSFGCQECEVTREWQCDHDLTSPSQCSGPAYVDLAVGARHVCLVDGDGRVTCVGTGLDCRGEPSFVLEVPPLEPVTSIAAMGDLTCVIQEGAGLECWGASHSCEGESFELSMPPDEESTVVRTAHQVSTGPRHVCIASSVAWLCWGDPTPFPTNQRKRGTVAGLAIGSDFYCWLRGTTSCLGSEADGRTTPPDIEFGSIAAGNDFGCGLDGGGRMSCWGRFDFTVPNSEGLRNLSCAGRDCCWLNEDESVRCTGALSDAPDGAFTAVRAGENFACATPPSGGLICWGGPFER